MDPNCLGADALEGAAGMVNLLWHALAGFLQAGAEVTDVEP